jgi:RNA polymerase sigma-70 factor (ECF subfamily)
VGDDIIATEAGHIAAGRAAREHYSRLLATLAAQFRDVAAAEDALSESLVAALAHWPVSGVPENPAAWLLTVARRRLTDTLRRQKTLTVILDRTATEAETPAPSPEMNDKRLELLFACAHPSIDEAMRAPLMLQVVFGFDASAVAAVFLLTPANMAQRLVRAKRKIRDANIPFRIPEPEEYPERLASVLTAIYALFTRDGANWHPRSQARESLADEAIWLGQLVVVLSHRDPEALGLLALMLFVESRREAKRDEQRRYVPLSEQEVGKWDATLIGRAENLLHEAAARSAPGRFQLEAAIQSVHCARARTGTTDWCAILTLYDGLFALSPSPVVAVHRALALLHTEGAEAALAALDEWASDVRLQDYQPFWAARAHVLARCGTRDEAKACYDRAIQLEEDPAIQEHLRRQIEALI